MVRITVVKAANASAPRCVLEHCETLRAITAGRSARSARLLVGSTAGCGGIARPGLDHSASRYHPAAAGYRGRLTGDGATDESVGFRSPALAAERLPRPPCPPGGRATAGWLASGCSVHLPQTHAPVRFWFPPLL